MTRHVKLVICLIVALRTGPAFSQVAATQANSDVLATAGAPAAFVYVSSSSSNNDYEINAYATASDGRLTPVPGSPFPGNVQYIAANKKYLFGTNGIDIDSFSVSSDGTLKQVASIDAQGFNTGSCGGPWVLFLDRTGTKLYDNDIYSDCANNAFQFFDVGGSAGELHYLGVSSAASPEFEGALSFLGNNKYAYGASCYHWNQEIYGFARSSDGALTDLNINPTMPEAKAGDIYCPGLTAADTATHVAVAMQPLNNSSLQPDGSAQLATYTADSSGNLITASTYANMPKVALASVAALSMSPSGKLLAVAGTGGLQVFHFNGIDPITRYTGLLTRDDVDQMFWDNDDHLYAVSQSAGKLFVFSVTPTSYSQAPGSPYVINSPQSIVVLPE
ncbi:MAG: hypothetical protein WBW38_23600 [Candidatus Sulfotelmatobacter sp.]